MKLLPRCMSVCVLLSLVGCGQPYVTKERLGRGLVIVLPGIEGRGALNDSICRGLDAGGVDMAIELQDWTSWLGPGYNLHAERRNRGEARRIAQRILRYQSDHPDRPVLLVGHSGGGAMAAWIAEAMPAGRKLDGIVMLAPALSPKYMLDVALASCRRGAVSFYSRHDVAFLSVGTTVWGTMDGKHTPSAGYEGFDIPVSGSRRGVYRTLKQIAWNPRMAASGHTGGHLASSSEDFVKRYVAPFVRTASWTDELVSRILRGESVDPPRRGVDRGEPAAQAP